MYIERLELADFRNYERAAVEFDPGLNVICGKNASGKTNLVEAVYYLALGKSPRVNRDKDLISWGKDAFSISLTLRKRFRSYKLFAAYSSEKKFSLDNIPITRISDIIGLIGVVYFSPDELSIIKDAPSERRRYIDMSISQQKRGYFTDLVNYNRILDQRNKLLKTRLLGKEFDDVISIYNIQLAKYGARIINNRYLFSEKLQSISRSIHEKITGGSEALSVAYESRIPADSVTNIERELLLLLGKAIEKDRQLQYTSIGPHRDDLSISINGADVRKFGSQGQQRTAALTLKMSEVELYRDENGEYPILILDDVLSELDQDRARQLLEFTHGIQTLLTCTEFGGKADKIIHIDNGQIIN